MYDARPIHAYKPTWIRERCSNAPACRAKYCIRSSDGVISMAMASARGFPVSREISKAICSSSFRIILRAFITSRPRSRNERAAQSGCSARARPTARATSSGMNNGTRPISSPVAGLQELSSALSDLAGMLWAIAKRLSRRSRLFVSTTCGSGWLFSRVRSTARYRRRF